MCKREDDDGREEGLKVRLEWWGQELMNDRSYADTYDSGRHDCYVVTGLNSTPNHSGY